MAKRSRQPTLAGFDTAEKPEASSSPGDQPGFAAQDTAIRSETPATRSPPVTSVAALAGQTVYVVDAHSLIYQVFHALPEMSGPSGQPVGAVHGFVRDVLDLIEVRGADFLICAFDHPARTFRHDLDDQCKIHREEMPADLQLQMPVIQQFLAA